MASLRERLHRALFSVMGPPQLGDPDEPPAPPAPAATCPRCGQSYDDHEMVRTPRFTTPRCPV